MNERGLTAAEVAARVAKGQTNAVDNRPSRSVRDIFIGNIFTRFNALLFILTVVVIVVDTSILNAMFGFVMVVNAAIGIFQELHAKALLDRLAILNAPKARVVRDGVESEIDVKDVVLGDILHLKFGDQVVADGKVIFTNGLELDESMLTGESDSVAKGLNQNALSGSVVVAGDGYIRVYAVGANAYSNKITKQVKAFKRVDSELIRSTNKLLRYISWMLVIVGPIVLIGQLRLDSDNWQAAIVHAVAAIVGMIPEGLVLLTSMAFMLAVIKLVRDNVLVQQLPAVEVLARVDTILLDKTGTLTEGNIRFEAIIEIDHRRKDEIYQVLSTIAHRSVSPTNDALREATKGIHPAVVEAEVPFNSARKWSSVTINHKHWILGAPEILFTEKSGKLYEQSRDNANQGKRVLVLMETDEQPVASKLPKSRKPMALVIMREKVRSDAAETLAYFREQGVGIKIISGDSPLTVAAVARQVGVEVDQPFDARELPKSDNDLIAIVDKYNVFGRVQPEQKRRIAKILQAQGHVVAMTGDGVNDALALKDADLGIAMQSGATATKAVAELVLLDDKFSHLPSVLGEGRRVIANIERVANLFVLKNVYSLVLSLSVTLMGMQYPYQPGQMTVMSTLAIGIPAFILALAPNNRRYTPGFLKRVLEFSVPVGIIAAVAMLTNYYIVTELGVGIVAAGTATSIILMVISMWALIHLAYPLNVWKIALIANMFSIFLLVLMIPGVSSRFRFSIDESTLPIVLVVGAIAVFLCEVSWRIIPKLIPKLRFLLPLKR